MESPCAAGGAGVRPAGGIPFCSCRKEPKDTHRGFPPMYPPFFLGIRGGGVTGSWGSGLASPPLVLPLVCGYWPGWFPRLTPEWCDSGSGAVTGRRFREVVRCPFSGLFVWPQVPQFCGLWCGRLWTLCLAVPDLWGMWKVCDSRCGGGIPWEAWGVRVFHRFRSP